MEKKVSLDKKLRLEIESWRHTAVSTMSYYDEPEELLNDLAIRSYIQNTISQIGLKSVDPDLLQLLDKGDGLFVKKIISEEKNPYEHISYLTNEKPKSEWWWHFEEIKKRA